MIDCLNLRLIESVNGEDLKKKKKCCVTTNQKKKKVSVTVLKLHKVNVKAKSITSSKEILFIMIKRVNPPGRYKCLSLYTATK